MGPFAQSLIGGTIPAVALVLLYFVGVEKRITRIETDITWLKKEIPLCRPPLDDRTK